MRGNFGSLGTGNAGGTKPNRGIRTFRAMNLGRAMRGNLGNFGTGNAGGTKPNRGTRTLHNQMPPTFNAACMGIVPTPPGDAGAGPHIT
jgi:hypothetical protein